MTSRLDHLEHSLKKDIRSILDILHQQQKQYTAQQVSTLQTHGLNSQHRPNVSKPYQPSESEMSFELASGGILSEQQPRNVHRSSSQPETACEKGLLR